MDRLTGLRGTPDIKIITGIRRCGKSKLMQAFISHLAATDNAANIIFIDLTSLDNEQLKDYHALYDYVKEHTKEGANNYLLIDEVQMCNQFELAINSLHSMEIYDIYLTGSNAFLLSADLATFFTGRHIEIHVLPFSFKEYCTYYEQTDLQAAFDHYVVEGGLAGSYVYKKEEDKETYIREVYETIITRDLKEKYRLPDSLPLQNLAAYLMDNVGNVTTPNSISGALSANKMPISHVSVGRYLKYLCNAFLFYKADRYDIRGKRYLEQMEKYYLSDSGIRYALLGRRNMDWGRIYENIVYFELIRRGYKVYIGKLYKKEIDFVAMRGNEKLYIQVSDDIANPQTFEREVSPLLAIQDAYPKLIIARTRHEEYDHQGIRIIDIPRWLTDIK